MSDFFIGLATTAVVILLVEFLRGFDRKLIAAYTLVGIPFIYIGFCWKHVPSLAASVAAVAFFLVFAYFGYKRNTVLIATGLALHGAWDLVFPYFSDAAPEGYPVFCFTIDVLLAVYFYFRLRRG